MMFKNLINDFSKYSYESSIDKILYESTEELEITHQFSEDAKDLENFEKKLENLKIDTAPEETRDEMIVSNMDDVNEVEDKKTEIKVTMDKDDYARINSAIFNGITGDNSIDIESILSDIKYQLTDPEIGSTAMVDIDVMVTTTIDNIFKYTDKTIEATGDAVVDYVAKIDKIFEYLRDMEDYNTNI